MEKKRAYQYTTGYFKNALPEYKRKQDSILVRLVHRPLSFFAASLFCRIGASANMVSCLSMLVGLISCVSYLIDSQIAYFAGAVLINIWMILDCADGNIARAVKSLPLGEFVDASSGYIVDGLLYICLGIPAYVNDGLLIAHGNPWIIFMAGMASMGNILGRLFFQKFRSRVYEENIDIVIKVNDKDTNNALSRLRRTEDRIDKEIGLNGVVLVILYVAAITCWFDIIVVFYAIYNIFKCMATLVIFLRKVMVLNPDKR